LLFLPKYLFYGFSNRISNCRFNCGFIVGLTGVGGGSLMTPILLWFGIPPTTAVGDLLYAAFTKMGGIYVHHKKKNINWTITAWITRQRSCCITYFGFYIL
jgi:hypothetical protein